MEKAAAIYPGTFDPVTKGHLDIVRRASKMFGRVIVAVGENLSKRPLLPVDVRLDLLKKEVAELPNVEVGSFSGLLIDYAKSKGSRMVIRSLRAVSDFDVEFQMAMANVDMYPELETVFLLTDKRFLFVSSTLIKDICRRGGDVSAYVSPDVENALKSRL